MLVLFKSFPRGGNPVFEETADPLSKHRHCERSASTPVYGINLFEDCHVTAFLAMTN
jgi:hypothetical protein